MRFNFEVEAHWVGRLGGKPTFYAAHVPRRPPTVPGYWMPFYDRDATGLISICLAGCMVSVSWGGNVRNCPKGLEYKSLIWEAGEIYLKRSVRDEMRALAKIKMDAVMRQIDVMYGKAPRG